MTRRDHPRQANATRLARPWRRDRRRPSAGSSAIGAAQERHGEPAGEGGELAERVSRPCAQGMASTTPLKTMIFLSRRGFIAHARQDDQAHAPMFSLDRDSLGAKQRRASFKAIAETLRRLRR